MKEKRLELYIGNDAWTGSLKLSIPGKVFGEVYHNIKGNAMLYCRLDDKFLEYCNLNLINNSILLRDAINYNTIIKKKLNLRKSLEIERLSKINNKEKEINKLKGYLQRVTCGILGTIRQDLQESEDLYVGIREKRDEELAKGYYYRIEGAEIINIPYNLFAILEDKKIKINLEPDFLKESARNILNEPNKKNIREFGIKRRELRKLEELCDNNNSIKKRNKVIKGLIYLIKEGIKEN